MKVTNLFIKNFHQFKDFDLDLTYPKGHAKEGKPLDKVCFIGQSGSGKTKILEIIGGLTHNGNFVKEKYGLKNEDVKIKIKNFDLSYIQSLSDNTDHEFTVSGFEQLDNPTITVDELIEKDKDLIKKVKPNLIHYPADLKYEISDDTTTIDYKERTIIDFSIENASAIWNVILTNIQKYQEEELKIRQDISRVVEDKKSDLKAIKASLAKLEKWQKTSFNPILDIAEKCLDPILEKFHLKVKSKLDIQKKEDIGFIKIEDFNENEIPYGLWSTGTKQIVLSALPLYLLKPENTIILFDEPERSLYPDLQREIINYYTSLTSDCQFFFATHSPIIASCFEPWEIVELKFNKSGYISQEVYYNGERHVDNYTITPNYLTYDLILSKVFDLNETYSPIRDEKLNEVLMLRNQLEKLKREKKLSTQQGEKIYERYIKLAKQLSWEFELTNYEKD